MGQQDSFIDLRILLVTPDHRRYDLLQVAIEGFQFDRLDQVTNTQSALDQLFFNTYDLVILSGGLPSGNVCDLVDNLTNGDLASSCDPAIFCHCEMETVSELSRRNSSILFAPQLDSLSQIHDNLRGAFHLAAMKRTECPNQYSRITRKTAELACH
jgi:DNA-binding NtrC family response regulator